MLSTPQHVRKILTVLITALFLLIKTGSFAHGLEYGSAPHEHDGMVCGLSLSEDYEQDIALPPSEIKLEIITLAWFFESPSHDHALPFAAVQAAARGPPTL